MIVHAYRRAAYTSEPTNAEAPIWAAYRLPTEYPEIGVFRITDDSIYLLRTNASPEGVPGQRPHLWAFVAPSSSSMGVRCSVVLLGVCGSVVLFYVCLCLRRLYSAFWDNALSMDVDGSVVLFHGVFFFRSPVAEKPRIPPRARGNTAALPIPRQRYRFRTNASLEGVSGQRPHIWAFAAPSSSFKGVCASALCGKIIAGVAVP